jgi:hypothetical protein
MAPAFYLTADPDPHPRAKSMRIHADLDQQHLKECVTYSRRRRTLFRHFVFFGLLSIKLMKKILETYTVYYYIYLFCGSQVTWQLGAFRGGGGDKGPV